VSADFRLTEIGSLHATQTGGMYELRVYTRTTDMGAQSAWSFDNEKAR